MAVVRDITERRRVESMKDAFVSTVSHELRTPLTSIAGSLGLLAGGAAGALPDKAARLISIAHSNSQRLVRLINDILDVEKLESGKVVLNMKALDLESLAERSIDGVRGYAEQLGVALAVEVDDAVQVTGDEDRLIQVTTNLLSNALKFSPRGGEVTVRLGREGRLARFSVRDRGPGIAEAFRPRIFGKFAQADGTDSRAKGGTGLGLAIAREIAERHGGRLWFESVEGEGATFHLDLPAATAGEAAQPVDAAAPKLLVVEDDPDAARVMASLAAQEGFASDLAGTAREALRLAQERPYAAALVDLRLPDADGVALIRALRAKPATRDLPVMVISGDAARGRAKGGGLNVIDWMDKPVDPARLNRALDECRRPAGRSLILHVDDDPDIVELSRQTLGADADVVTAGSLAQARSALRRLRPDIVILDLGLPDGHGLELLPEFTREGAAIPVVVYSAQDMEAAVAPQVRAVLTKSRVSLERLTRTVRRLTAARDLEPS